MDSAALTHFALDHGAMLASVAGSMFAGSVAVAKYLDELRKSREQQLEVLKQRANELRWEQARAGKALNDEMLVDEEARGAMDMLDMEAEGQLFHLPGDRSFQATYEDVVVAITWRLGDSKTSTPSPHDRDYEPKWVQIRICFDSFFYYIAIIEHYLTSGLLHFDDVAYPLDYYVRQLAHDRWRRQFRIYIDYYRLGRARRFLQRFESWRVHDDDHHDHANDLTQRGQ